MLRALNWVIFFYSNFRKRRRFEVIFRRKKKKLENFNTLGFINDITLPLTPLGEKITNSYVVLISIDRIASQCAKLKGRYIKRSEDGIITERNNNLSFLLKSKPNEYVRPYQFIYKVISLLLLMTILMSIHFMVRIH